MIINDSRRNPYVNMKADFREQKSSDSASDRYCKSNRKKIGAESVGAGARKRTLFTGWKLIKIGETTGAAAAARAHTSGLKV